MKIAVFSDTHTIHYRNFPYNEFIDDLKQENPDLILDSGDYDNEYFHETLIDELNIPIISVQGNHDFYDRNLEETEKQPAVIDFNGLKIVKSTLWTSFNNNDPLTHIIVKSALNDSRFIGGYRTEFIYDRHLRDVKFIKENMHDVDIILTHHAPSLQSIHPKYKDEGLLNFGFVSDLDDLVAKSKAKYWIHGHVHDPFDYMIDQTRVICNPFGYPHENEDFKIKYITI